ncbi:hypothetical protein V6N13_025361 [Hibiscus sabdariffa]
MKNSSIFICGAASVERVSIIIRSSTLLSVGFATMMFLPQVLNLVDKSKAKPAVRTSDMSINIKGRQQQYGNQSSLGGHVKSDTEKTTGKLSVLEPGWENGVSSPSQKDVASPMINANSKVATSQHAVAVESAGERKAATLRLEPNSWVHCGKETFLGSNPESK